MNYKVNGFDLRNLATRGSNEKTRSLGALIQDTEGKEGDDLRMAGDRLMASDHKLAPKIHEMLFGKGAKGSDRNDDENIGFTDKTYGDYGDADQSDKAMAFQKLMMSKKDNG